APGEIKRFEIPGVQRFISEVKKDVAGRTPPTGGRPAVRDQRTQPIPKAALDPFLAGVSRLGDSRLRPLLREQIKQNPELVKRQKIYLTGGVTWVMATCRHPKDAVAIPWQPSFRLTTRDIDNFRSDVRRAS